MEKILLAALAVMTLLAQPPGAALQIDPPPGWYLNADPQTRMVTFSAPGVPFGQRCEVLIFPAQDAAIPAQAILDQLVRNATAGQQPFAPPTYLDVGPFRAAVFSQQTRLGVQHMAIHVARWAGRSQAVAYVATDGTLFQMHGAAVHAVLSAVTVPSATPTVRNTPLVTSQPRAATRSIVVEAWRRPAQRTWMNIDGSTFTGKLQYERIALLANGVADFSLYHATGLAADRDLLAATPATLNGFYGSWRAEGNTIRLRRQAGQPEEVMIRENGNLRLGATVWTPTPRVDGMRLNGRYAYRSEPGLQPFNYWIQFTEDGRFQTGGALAWFAVSDMTGRPRPPDSVQGVYEIRDWTIFFIVNGVPVWSTEIMPLLEEVKNPSVVLLDTYAFRR